MRANNENFGQVNLTRWSRLAAAPALAALLLSCGGGGGGGENEPEPPPEPISYTGSTTPVVLTTGNAAEVAGSVWNALLVAQAMADLGIVLDDFTGDIDESQAGPQGGTVSVVGTLTNGLGELTIDFDSYRGSGFSVDGQFTQLIRRAPVNGEPDDLTLDIPRLTFTGGFGPRTASLVISGQLTRQQRDSNPDPERTLLANLVVRNEQSGEEGWLRDVRIERRSELPPVGLRTVETYTGQVYDGQLGMVTIASTGALWFRAVLDREPPYGGGALKITSNGSAVRVRPVNARLAALLFDDTNDGTSDRHRLVDWDDLIGGTVPVPAGSNPPLPAAVSREPVQTGAPLELIGYLNADPDGDWLTVRWGLALEPIGGNAAVVRPQSPEAQLTPPLDGDYLLTLQVSDGLHTVWDSARITAAATVEPEPGAGTQIAVLRRPPDSTVNQALQLDASPSFSTLYDDPLSWAWDLAGSSGNTTDGRYTYTPTAAGLYGLAVAVCRNGYNFPCTSTERIVSVGVSSRFFRPSTLSTGFVARRSLVGDFDGDGRDDLVMQSTSVGSGTRPPPDALDVIFRRDTGYVLERIPAPGDGRMAGGDLSGDGRDDVVVVSPLALTVARRGAAGPFVTETLALAACAIGGSHLSDVVAIADANGDGRQDLLHLDTCRGELVTRLQTVGGALGSPTSVAMAVNGGQLVAIGDLNSDSRADLLSGVERTGVENRGKFRVFLAQPDGSYATSQEFSLIDGSTAPSVAIGDVTGDGRNDAIAGDDTRVLVARQLPDGSLADPDSYAADHGASGEQLFVADYDGDGRHDLRSNGDAIFLQSATGALLPGYRIVGDLGPARGFETPLPIDLNGDGYMDLVGVSPDGFRPEESSGPVLLMGRPPDS